MTYNLFLPQDICSGRYPEYTTLVTTHCIYIIEVSSLNSEYTCSILGYSLSVDQHDDPELL